MDAYYGSGARPYESLTYRGVSYFYKAFALFIVAGVLGVAMAAVSPTALGAVGSLNTTSNETNVGALSQLAGILALTCGLLIVDIIGLVLAILGLWTMHKGKAEYGTAHEKSVDRALLFFGGAVAVFIIDMAVSIGITLAGMVGTGGTTPRSAAPSALLTAVSNGLGVLMAIFVVLMFYHLVKNLMAPERRDLFIIAMGIYVLSSALSWILSAVFPIPAAFYEDPSSVDMDFQWLLPGIVGAAVSLIAMIMFLFMFREIAVRLKAKIIKPIWETTLPQTAGTPQPVQELRWQPPPST